jgi:hypothetical protein
MKRKPNLKRAAKRLYAREMTLLNKEWIITTVNFNNELILTDWDEVEDYDVFQKYNEKWIKTCQKLKKKFKFVEPDPYAFYEYAKNQDSDKFDAKERQEDTNAEEHH